MKLKNWKDRVEYSNIWFPIQGVSKAKSSITITIYNFPKFINIIILCKERPINVVCIDYESRKIKKLYEIEIPQIQFQI